MPDRSLQDLHSVDQTHLGEDATATIVEHRVSQTAKTEVSDRIAHFRRRDDRLEYGVPVTLYALGRAIHGEVTNVSISGMFVATAGLLPRHSDVGFELPLPDGSTEPMRARLVRIQEETEVHRAGLGLAFIKVDARLRSRLVSLIKSLRLDDEDDDPSDSSR
jgi:hypothetical protein